MAVVVKHQQIDIIRGSIYASDRTHLTSGTMAKVPYPSQLLLALCD